MKRKIISFLCCLALLPVALSGCAPVPVPAPENKGSRAAPAESAAQPTDGYPLTVGGAVLRPPLALPELDALGFAVAAPGAATLAPRAWSESVAVTGRGTSFTGRLYNPAEEARPWRDCLLAAFSVKRDATADGDVAIGSLERDVNAAYGSVNEGTLGENVHWMLYGTCLYYGLGFEIDDRSQRVVSMATFCVPLGETEAKRP